MNPNQACADDAAFMMVPPPPGSEPNVLCVAFRPIVARQPARAAAAPNDLQEVRA